MSSWQIAVYTRAMSETLAGILALPGADKLKGGETPRGGNRWAPHEMDIAEQGSLPPVGSQPFLMATPPSTSGLRCTSAANLCATDGPTPWHVAP